jgi:two-component system, LuxR family, response regulator FixJ
VEKVETVQKLKNETGFMMDMEKLVYVIDDDAGVRESLACVLAGEGRRVETFESAEEFLEGAREVHPCCVIMDLRLPRMGGMELLAEMRRRGWGLAVIMMTAYAEVPTAVRAMRLGVVDICQKPVDPGVLVPLVERVLAWDTAQESRRRQITEARQRLAGLTRRERELFELVVEGLSYKEMAALMGISTRTVEHHRAHISTKLGVDRVADMVRMGIFAKDHGPLASVGEISN